MDFLCTFYSAPGGDLQKVIDDDNVPYEADVVKFIHHVVEGLAYMHQRKIAHLDIKVNTYKSVERVKVFLFIFFLILKIINPINVFKKKNKTKPIHHR